MEKSNKQKTTVEVSLKNSLSNWQDVVYKYQQDRIARDYRFWEDSWNDEFED